MAVTDYKDKHTGERIFIVGNGPSLEHTPLSLLQDEYSIAMNRIDNLFNKTSWRPTYYLQANNPPYGGARIRRISSINERGITSFVGHGSKQQLKGKLQNPELCEFININHERSMNVIDVLSEAKEGRYHSFWSTDIEEQVYLWETSLYVATQIASYMGFDEFYFVGCDLYPVFKPLPFTLFERGNDPTNFIRKPNDKETLKQFVTSGDSILASVLNGAWFKIVYRTPIIDGLYQIHKRINRIPQTHFEGGDPECDRFYDVGTNRGLINLHRLIKAIGTHEGFECYNATKGGSLEVHERVDIRDIT